MKRILYILICFSYNTVHLDAQATNLDAIYASFTAPIGIYYSFDEIKKKQPKDPTYLRIVKRSRKDISLNGGGLYGIELESISKQERKKIGKECLGISDGEIFVFSGNYTLGGWRGYSKAYLSGPLVYIPFETTLAKYTGGGIIPSLIKTSRGLVFDVNLGKQYKLEEKLLQAMVEKHHIQGYEGRKLMKNAAAVIMEVNKKRTRKK